MLIMSVLASYLGVSQMKVRGLHQDVFLLLTGGRKRNMACFVSAIPLDLTWFQSLGC